MSTPPSSPASRTVRFGIFEADLVAGTLRKNGTRLRLQEQPFQLLVLLLERAGDVVTREELRQKLWPSDTFVDFDHGLNTAVNKVREALGDSASSPRYVETLARRGYRFLAPVEHSAAALGQVAAAQQSEAIPVQRRSDAAFHPEMEMPLPHRGLTRWLFILIQIMYLVFYLIALFRLREVERIADAFLPGQGASAVVAVVMVTAGVGIVLRFYLLSAAGFDYRQLRENFERLFLAILLLDQLWALSPFLAAEKIGFGTAFATMAAMLYLPFSQRTLLRMAYPAASPTKDPPLH